ncbi:MAG: ABC transporter ATP-binding protein [Spirochaetales bacterium]|nr:MAG: ABC transporter ATP-binding protein [Spirochaetales bacterium]
MTMSNGIKSFPFVSMRKITKSFPHVLANDAIDFDIFHSEIHALLGDNDSGKSTLMKILYGYYRGDAGEILFNNKPVSIKSPQDARNHKIGMVFQDFTQIPAFSVLENIALFLQDLQPVYKQKEVAERILDIAGRYGMDINPAAPVSGLSIGEQQKVEILKLLLSDARLLILDEPTRVLAPHEVDALFEVLGNLRKDGYAIVMITHKMKEVFACSDRITVLREGKVSGSMLRSETTDNRLIELMFSTALPALRNAREIDREPEEVPVLKLADIHTRSEGNTVSLKDVNLEISSGEIVGVAGVSGNGQRELGDVILGIERSTRGTKLLSGKDCTNRSVGDIRRSGVGFIPENPLAMASIPFMTVLENMVLTGTGRYSRHGGLTMDWNSALGDFRGAQERLGFECPFNAVPNSLSGGNLQKMVIVREMTHNPRLLVALYITRGLDVKSTVAVHEALLKARENRAGVLLISEDLEELFALSDRIIVLYKGEIIETVRPGETTMYKVGRLMTGAEVLE